MNHVWKEDRKCSGAYCIVSFSVIFHIFAEVFSPSFYLHCNIARNPIARRWTNNGCHG